MEEKILRIEFIGIDNWERPVYKDDLGKLYKDISLGKGNLNDSLCTVYQNNFDGEPDTPIENYIINIKTEENDQAKSKKLNKVSNEYDIGKIYNEAKKLLIDYKSQNKEETIEEKDKIMRGYIIRDLKTQEIEVMLAYDSNCTALVYPYKEESKRIIDCSDWNFSYDEYLFKSLDKNYRVENITYDAHYNIWATIEECFPEDIENKLGMQRYLKYCKEKDINLDKITEHVGFNILIDVMQFYKDENNINNEKKSKSKFSLKKNKGAR